MLDMFHIKIIISLLTLIPLLSNSAENIPERHAIAMHGDVKYPSDFTHFDYVNPNAPDGGTLKLFAIGSFDSFNPYISKGVPANGIAMVYESLVTQSKDEAFTVYGLVAESMQVPEHRGWVIFNLRKEAKFSDGKPITAEDVIFSFNTLRTQGKPAYQFFYMDVASVEALSSHQVKFTFKHQRNRELALTVGTFPIFQKKVWDNREFDSVDLVYPVGSGPYQVASHSPGKKVTFQKNPDYWGKELAVNKGRHNFNNISYDYYLDQTVALEAFKAGEYHYRAENNSKFWATSYTGENFDKELIKIEEIPHQEPVGMQAFIFNLRKPIFQDIKLREAMAYAFDFEWSNKNLFYGQYRRTNSYFQNTELAASQLPEAAELAILEPFKDKLSPKIFTEVYQPPLNSGNGNVRKNLAKASRILKQAGYQIKQQKLFSPSGEPVAFEFLMYDSAFERIVLPMVRNLKILGIIATPRKVDLNQYIERLREHKFDMVVTTFGQSLSPGNEQRSYWTSSSADQRDSKNLIGIKDPVIDQLVEQLIQARDRQALVNHTRALDRVLQSGHYLIPNWHVNYHRLAFWKHLMHPKVIPPYGLDLMAWWSEEQTSP